MRLGITCTTDEKGLTLNRLRDDGVNLVQLERSIMHTRKPYLDCGKPLKYLFLYHAYAPTSPVHVYALFLPNGTLKLHIVDPAPRRQPIPRLDSVYNELLAQRQEELEITDLDIAYILGQTVEGGYVKLWIQNLTRKMNNILRTEQRRQQRYFMSSCMRWCYIRKF